MDWWHSSRKTCAASLIARVAGLGVKDGFPQVRQHCGQIVLELLPRLSELLDLGQFVVEELPHQRVQGGRVGHVHPQGFPLVLEQDGGTGVLEEDVVAGIPLGELVPDFPVQVVVGVLGFPQAAGHAEGVADRAVGLVAAVST